MTAVLTHQQKKRLPQNDAFAKQHLILESSPPPTTLASPLADAGAFEWSIANDLQQKSLPRTAGRMMMGFPNVYPLWHYG